MVIFYVILVVVGILTGIAAGMFGFGGGFVIVPLVFHVFPAYGVLSQADALVNVTNDAWFGHSTARYQHFQIARMRALEAGRYLIRAANNGVTGVIGPHGEVEPAPERGAAMVDVEAIVSARLLGDCPPLHGSPLSAFNDDR